MVDLNNTLKYKLPDKTKISVTKADVRIKSNLKISQTSIFAEKSFIYTILGFIRSRSYPLYDIDRVYQLIAGSYKSDRPINITGIDKIRLNVIVYKITLLTVSENQFCTPLCLVQLRDIKHSANQE